MLRIVNEKDTTKFGELGVGDIFVCPNGERAFVVVPVAYQASLIEEQVVLYGINDLNKIQALPFNVVELETGTRGYFEPDDDVIIPVETTLIIK